MKKALSILLAMIMVLSMFAACGKAPAADQPQAGNAEAPAADQAPENAEPIKLRIILQAADDVRIGIMNDYIVPNFEAAFPGYELEISTITGDFTPKCFCKYMQEVNPHKPILTITR